MTQPPRASVSSSLHGIKIASLPQGCSRSKWALAPRGLGTEEATRKCPAVFPSFAKFRVPISGSAGVKNAGVSGSSPHPWLLGDITELSPRSQLTSWTFIRSKEMKLG